MKKYTFDEICDSQDFNHDQEFIEIETFNLALRNAKSVMKAIKDSCEVCHQNPHNAPTVSHGSMRLLELWLKNYGESNEL